MAYHLWSGHGTRTDRKVGFCFFDTTLWSPSLPRSPGESALPRIVVRWPDGPDVADRDLGRLGGHVPLEPPVPVDRHHRTAGRDVHGPRDVRPERLVPRGGRDGGGAAARRCGSARAAHRYPWSVAGPVASTTGRARPSRPTSTWAFANGITTGCDVDMYCHGNAVTRAQMAMFIDRAMDLPPTDEDFFTDDDGATGEAAINRLAAARHHRWLRRRRFCPHDTVTRGQMASFLVRALDLPRPGEPRPFQATTTARRMSATSTACSKPASRAVAARTCYCPKERAPAARWPPSCIEHSRTPPED